MRLKALLYYALLGLNQATGFAGGYDYMMYGINNKTIDIITTE